MKGYDGILIQDASATSSPQYATDMVLYNAALDGFVYAPYIQIPVIRRLISNLSLNSTDIVAGLA